MFNFRIYGYSDMSPKYITTVFEEQYIKPAIMSLDTNVYSRAIVIKHTIERNQDEVYETYDLEETYTKKRTKKY